MKYVLWIVGALFFVPTLVILVVAWGGEGIAATRHAARPGAKFSERVGVALLLLCLLAGLGVLLIAPFLTN